MTHVVGSYQRGSRFVADDDLLHAARYRIPVSVQTWWVPGKSVPLVRRMLCPKTGGSRTVDEHNPECPVLVDKRPRRDCTCGLVRLRRVQWGYW